MGISLGYLISSSSQRSFTMSNYKHQATAHFSHDSGKDYYEVEFYLDSLGIDWEKELFRNIDECISFCLKFTEINNLYEEYE